MGSRERVTLTRDCEATEIPSGRKATLYAGTEVIVTQSLGGTFTVVTHQGLMASVDGKDADAIGKQAEAQPSAQAEPGEKTTEQLVWDKLRSCYDPEIPHNIVDLGLIYECKLSDIETGGKKVDIKMTLTAPGCGMGDWLRRDAEQKILAIPGVKEARVEVVFDPPWNPSMMSPALRRALNMM